MLIKEIFEMKHERHFHQILKIETQRRYFYQKFNRISNYSFKPLYYSDKSININ
jgi:hypothetical protein